MAGKHNGAEPGSHVGSTELACFDQPRTCTQIFWDLFYSDTKVTAQHCGCIKGRCSI